MLGFRTFQFNLSSRLPALLAMDRNLDLGAPHSMGTTIIGVTYNGGVVLGADSRTSTGTLITTISIMNYRYSYL